ncbi:hypothetical protein RHGRI_006374 [Rhododendron griersonianum]|uniref:Protein N-terminal glutamine amidohydrolase n=1 Tax=Rhododendron griersonianum TaxID=479676 RepID=A0AAV6KTG2_9ERIC|nr:hypothetical protein RHGRI_006374 [Rhododendron griersonianum]
MATSELDSTSTATAVRLLDVSQFQHTSSYCALFVPDFRVPLWHQKASHRADGVILWDYHVICIQVRTKSHHFCVDKRPIPTYNLASLQLFADSSLPCPSPLASYVSETIRPSFQLFADFQRFFWVVRAPIFLCSFASDRRHMKDSLGNWTAKPPAYGPIVAEAVQLKILAMFIARFDDSNPDLYFVERVSGGIEATRISSGLLLPDELRESDSHVNCV